MEHRKKTGDMKITDSAALGEAIRKRRKELHYTQSDLADFSGLSVSFLSNLENGKPTCEIGKAIYVIQLLGMDCVLKERGESDRTGCQDGGGLSGMDV